MTVLFTIYYVADLTRWPRLHGHFYTSFSSDFHGTEWALLWTREAYRNVSDCRLTFCEM